MKRIRDLESRYWLDRLGPALTEVGFRYEPKINLECPPCSTMWKGYHGGISIWPGPIALEDPSTEGYLKDTLFIHQHLNEYYFLALDNEDSGIIRRFANTRNENDATVLSFYLTLGLFQSAVKPEFHLPPDALAVLRQNMGN